MKISELDHDAKIVLDLLLTEYRKLLPPNDLTTEQYMGAMYELLEGGYVWIEQVEGGFRIAMDEDFRQELLASPTEH